ncbi:MAG: hypothetical protein M3277_09080 [Actinomycetota bacterium]|nr:hypothetical protein [Actinomycetota bacterium]
MRRVAAPAFALLFFAACDSPNPDVAATPTPLDATGPYVSVAVDNHFHDIHPEDHKMIGADRAFVVRNEGRNLHNVTILGTNVNRDVRPGRSLTLDPVGKTLDPGTYRIVCKYHDYVGMTGEITIAE